MSEAGQQDEATPVRLLKRRLLSGSAWAFAGKILIAFCGLASSALLARLLSQEELGLYFLAYSVVMLGVTLGMLGLGQTVVRLVAQNMGLSVFGRVRSVIGVVLGVGALGALGVGLAYWLYGGKILAISTAPGADAQTTVCDRTISEGKSVQGLVDSLNPGQTGCLREGIYYEKQVIFKQGGTQAQRIDLRSVPGQRAIFRGGFVIRDGANNISINHLRIDGSYGRVKESNYPTPKDILEDDKVTLPAIRVWEADNVNIHNNNVTNRRPNGNPDLAGQCLLIGGGGTTAGNISIKGNRIHHCGQLPPINGEHGIYLSSATDAKIQDNLLYKNADSGLLIQNGARRALVSGNVFDSNNRQVTFHRGPSGNTVRNNVLSNPRKDFNAHTTPNYYGSGNAVHDNCVWSSDGMRFRLDKIIKTYGNVVADPRYENQRSYYINNPECRNKYSGSQAK